MIEGKKEDRRITRTKEALHQALSELVKEKGYSAVTIEEITSRAKMGRTTFYLHYQDKEDLVLESMEDRLAAVIDLITSRPLLVWFRESNGRLMEMIFESVLENKDIFAIICQEPSNKVYDRFRKIINTMSLKMISESPWAQKKVGQLSISIDFVISYFSGAMWSTIVWWANHGFEPNPKEMSKNFSKMFFPGLLRILNVKRLAALIESAVID
ncbi:MAG: TetR/AcrR family transcriptional regulator [Anaerolineaceae bacterium]|nr:TetR/AcrR family transcriptional regulator [Anaerolineaceae bacterium]